MNINTTMNIQAQRNLSGENTNNILVKPPGSYGDYSIDLKTKEMILNNEPIGLLNSKVQSQNGLIFLPEVLNKKFFEFLKDKKRLDNHIEYKKEIARGIFSNERKIEDGNLDELKVFFYDKKEENKDSENRNKKKIDFKNKYLNQYLENINITKKENYIYEERKINLSYYA